MVRPGLGPPRVGTAILPTNHAARPEQCSGSATDCRNSRVSGNWQKVGETLQRARTVAVSNDDRKAILVDMGELLERNMSKVEDGLAHYRQALEVDPFYLPALEALERIYEAQDDIPQLVEILTSKVQALTDPEQVARHKLRIAQLYENSIRNLEKAGNTYREVLDIDSGNITALRGLSALMT